MKDNAARHALLDGVRKIAVLNPSAVGDFVATLPAMHALKAAYPQARIVYVGKPWHTKFLQGRPSPIDDVAVIPPVPGVGASEDMEYDHAKVESFLQEMQSHRFDLAFQMYGGGRYSNPFLRKFGARLSAGLKAPDAEPLDRWLPYVYLQNNRLRMLEVAGLAGAWRLQPGPELAVISRDREEAASIVPGVLAKSPKPLIVLHPAASDVRRHWPADRFAQVGDALAEQGAVIAINGVNAEADIVHDVVDHMRYPAIDLTGKLSLSGLLGLLECSALLISNDSGPLHLALAIGTPCVGIYWLTNLYVAGPLFQQRHRAALSMQVQCPVCGKENINTRCSHEVSFVGNVGVEEIRQHALDLLSLSANCELPAAR
jgi:ADP-heptose:LPS heptosyltransferase